MVKRICLLLAAFFTILQLPVYAGPLYKAQTRQIYCFSDIMRAYIDMEDQNSAPIDKPQRSSVIGYIDGTKLTTASVNRFGDTGEGVAYIFLVDVSGSLKDNQMVKVRSAIKTWAANMKDNDKIAVMTFGNEVKTLTDFSSDKNAVNSAVNKIENSDNNTQLYGGISQALKLATRNDKNLPKRRNIMLITDGVNDYSGGISESDVFAQLKSSLVPVYSMWMPGSGANREKGRSALNSVTEYSGGTIYDMSDKEIDTVYGWIRQSILNSYTVDFSYGGAAADNAAHTFKVRVAENDKVAEDTAEFTMTKTDEESGTYQIAEASEKDSESDGEDTEDSDSEDGESKNKKLFVILGIAAVCLTAAACAVIFAVMRKKQNDSFDGNTGSYYESGPNNYEPPQTSNYIPSSDTDKTINIGYDPTRQTFSDGIRVTLVSSSGKRFSAALSGRITIGRGGICDIALGAPTISGTHASLTLVNGKPYLDDLHSVNGTLVNGRLISEPTEIKSGDTVMFGSEEYKITF